MGGEHQALLARLRGLVPDMQRRAALHDEAASFPEDDIAALRDTGALAAPLPLHLGGLGWGTEPDGAAPLAAALHAIGRGSAAVGRLYEGHVNGIALLVAHGGEATVARFADDLRSGHLSAIWATEAPPGTRMRCSDDGWTLAGRKSVCSGAGYVTRPVVTLGPDGLQRLAMLSLEQGERVLPGTPRLAGARAAAGAPVGLDGYQLPDVALIGDAGDYLREPMFSIGAWRPLAVIAGALSALADGVRDALAARGRDGAPPQRARLGALAIAAETARLWAARTAIVAEDPRRPDAARVGQVGLAREAVLEAAERALTLAARSVGLAAYLPSPVERMMRDLGTYLRQPAPDEAFEQAAAHWTGRNGTC